MRRNKIAESPKLSNIQRYTKLFSKIIRLVADVLTSKRLHQLVENGVHEVCKCVMEVRIHEDEMVNDEDNDPIVQYQGENMLFKQRAISIDKG